MQYSNAVLHKKMCRFDRTRHVARAEFAGGNGLALGAISKQKRSLQNEKPILPQIYGEDLKKRCSPNEELILSHIYGKNRKKNGVKSQFYAQLAVSGYFIASK